VVLVPGIGGTQVEQRFVNAKGPHFFCSTNQDWSRVWLKLSNLVPKVWDCFAARIARSWNGSAWLDQPGVMTRPGQGLDAIAYLDPADFLTRRESIYFGATIQALQSAGYTNASLAAMPYDWRMAAGENDVFVDTLRATVESLYSSSGDRPVVLASHSMGGPMTHYFLMQMSASWKKQYIARWLAVCSPFGGAAVALKAVLSGYNFGIPVLSNGEGLLIGPYMGGTFFLLPRNNTGWGANLLTTLQGDVFNASQLVSVFEKAGLKQPQQKVAQASRYWSEKDPGVDVSLVAGSSLKTEVAYRYDATNFRYGPLDTTYASGDGTVPLESALLPNSTFAWSRLKSSVVFPNVDHVGMLANSNFLTWLLGELSSLNA